MMERERENERNPNRGFGIKTTTRRNELKHTVHGTNIKSSLTWRRTKWMASKYRCKTTFIVCHRIDIGWNDLVAVFTLIKCDEKRQQYSPHTDWMHIEYDMHRVEWALFQLNRRDGADFQFHSAWLAIWVSRHGFYTKVKEKEKKRKRKNRKIERETMHYISVQRTELKYLRFVHIWTFCLHLLYVYPYQMWTCICIYASVLCTHYGFTSLLNVVSFAFYRFVMLLSLRFFFFFRFFHL